MRSAVQCSVRLCYCFIEQCIRQTSCTSKGTTMPHMPLIPLIKARRNVNFCTHLIARATEQFKNEVQMSSNPVVSAVGTHKNCVC
eukprot:5267398-Amphidinium_carterae.1